MANRPTPAKNSDVNGTLVTGDFIIDQHIYEGERHQYADHTPGVRVKAEVGGAGKLAELIQALFDKLDPEQFADVHPVVAARVAPESVQLLVDGSDPATPIAHHAYAFWRRRPEGEPREKQRWRCIEAMGFGALVPQKTPEDGVCRTDAPCAAWPVPENIPPKPAIIAISEGGMGFRDNEMCWEKEALKHANHIIFKTANQPAESDVWKELTKHADKLTVVISTAELRKTSARISVGLTWEETFRDLLRELAGKPEVDQKKSKTTETEATPSGVHDTWNQIMLRSGNMKPKDIETLKDRKDKWNSRNETLDQEKASIENSMCDDKVKALELERIKSESEKVRAELTRIESNTGAAERMPRILALVNLQLKSGANQWSENDQLLVRRRIAFHQELLACEEHREWMDWYLERGWTFDPKRDDSRKKHHCLKPFSELPENEKDKDRTVVSNYPNFAISAGYRIELFKP